MGKITIQGVQEEMRQLGAEHLGYSIQLQGNPQMHQWFTTPEPNLFFETVVNKVVKAYITGREEIIETSVIPLIRQMRDLLDGKRLTKERRDMIINLCNIVDENIIKPREGIRHE